VTDSIPPGWQQSLMADAVRAPAIRSDWDVVRVDGVRVVRLRRVRIGGEDIPLGRCRVVRDYVVEVGPEKEEASGQQNE